MKNSWAMQVKREANELGINLEEGLRQLKSEFKREVKGKLESKVKEDIKKTDGTKLRTVKKKDYGEKNYLKGNFEAQEVAEIMKIKLHMLNLKMNYTNGTSNSELICRLCYGHLETTEHIFLECKTLQVIREQVNTNELETDHESSISSILKFKRIASIIMTEL